MKTKEELFTEVKKMQKKIKDICTDPKVLELFPNYKDRMILDEMEYMISEQISIAEQKLLSN